MKRRILMWLGFRPVTLANLRITRCGAGQYKITFNFDYYSWATEEDFAIARAQAISDARKLVGLTPQNSRVTKSETND